MDLWCIELGRARESLAPVLSELWTNRTATSLQRQTEIPSTVAVVADGTRSSAAVRLLSADDPRQARTLIIVDSPFAPNNYCLAAQDVLNAHQRTSSPADIENAAQDLARVLGPEFAFALIDMNHESVALVRDPIGARPLYWRRNRNTVGFASSRERLLKFGPAPRVDESAVAINLASGNDAWRSGELLTDFYRVPHGGYTLLSQGSAKAGQWWAPARTSLSRRRDEWVDVIRHVRGILENAVTSRLSDNQTVGAHVSGGIDSTGVAAVGARRLMDAGRTLVAAYAWSPAVGTDFPEMGLHDERQRIELFANKENVRVRFGGASSNDLIAFLARPIELEGTADLTDEMPILRMAQSDGVQIMLSGWGGDEVFSSHGYGYLSHLIATLQWDRAVRWIRAHLGTLRRTGALAAYLWWQGVHPMLPDSIYRLFDPYGIADPSRSLISPTLLKLYREQVHEVRHAFRVTPRVHETMFNHFMVGHITHRMESWDVWSQQHGFRYTYPLTDWRLVEALLSLANEQHFPNETPRGLARDSLSDVLPAGATKFDAANEASRTATRSGAWRSLAAMAREGQFRDNCPWLDMKRFREQLANPVEQNSAAGILQFYEVFKAVRVWHLWARQEGIVCNPDV